MAEIRANNPVLSISVMVFGKICTILPKDFHIEYGKYVATVLQFSETSNKEFSNALGENLSFL